jgi:anti-sigma factor RsiW
LGGAAGWTLRGSGADSALAPAASGATPLLASLPHKAAVAHAVYTPEVRHPVEVGADQQQHLVAWLSKRLGKQLRPPQLARQGYQLVGGRLLPGDTGPVAQFMYADAGGQRLTLYVSPGQKGNRDTGFRFAQEGGVAVFYWIDGSFGYALSAAVGKGELSQVASAVYEQLQP